jgi:hypothetical protein
VKHCSAARSNHVHERKANKADITRNYIFHVMLSVSFVVFTAVRIHVEVFWVVTTCNVLVGYRRFGWPCCYHLHTSPWRRTQHGPLKRWYPIKTLHGFTTQKTSTRNLGQFVFSAYSKFISSYSFHFLGICDKILSATRYYVMANEIWVTFLIKEQTHTGWLRCVRNYCSSSNAFK